jgi:hypothetical protein
MCISSNGCQSYFNVHSKMIHLNWGSIIVSVPSHAMSSISLSVPLYFPFFRSRSCWLIGVTCVAIDISCRLKFFYWASGKKPIEKQIVDVQLSTNCSVPGTCRHIKKLSLEECMYCWKKIPRKWRRKHIWPAASHGQSIFSFDCYVGDNVF